MELLPPDFTRIAPRAALRERGYARALRRARIRRGLAVAWGAAIGVTMALWPESVSAPGEASTSAIEVDAARVAPADESEDGTLIAAPIGPEPAQTATSVSF
ncbi:MAG: hypothetical protein MJB57_11335 [Gemmatimonadetes bacterium]|nr:hypothetical protein [Gemmatimonadota bacterium]